MIILRKSCEEIPYTTENVKKYKSPKNLLSKAMMGDDISGIMLIDKETRDLIGYCAWKGNYIVALEVISEYRRKGFGKELLRRALKEGCNKLAVDRKNTNAINLYKEFGFKDNKIDYGPDTIEMEI